MVLRTPRMCRYVRFPQASYTPLTMYAQTCWIPNPRSRITGSDFRDKRCDHFYWILFQPSCCVLDDFCDDSGHHRRAGIHVLHNCSCECPFKMFLPPFALRAFPSVPFFPSLSVSCPSCPSSLPSPLPSLFSLSRSCTAVKPFVQTPDWVTKSFVRLALNCQPSLSFVCSGRFSSTPRIGNLSSQRALGTNSDNLVSLICLAFHAKEPKGLSSTVEQVRGQSGLAQCNSANLCTVLREFMTSCVSGKLVPA